MHTPSAQGIFIVTAAVDWSTSTKEADEKPFHRLSYQLQITFGMYLCVPLQCALLAHIVPFSPQAPQYDLAVASSRARSKKLDTYFTKLLQKFI
jgi:hypothetical protein